MKLEINVQAKDFEVANMLLGKMIEVLEKSPEFCKQFNLSKNQIAGAKKVKNKLLKSYLKNR